MSTLAPQGWEAVIGLEIHVQLATRSKIFSGSATAYGAEPNAQASAVDLGLPGTLPVMNGEAQRMALAFGLAIGAEIAPRSVFARKNYFYPDLPKGYQISQYELPVVGRGVLPVRLADGREIAVPIERAHLEEDAGKSVHDAFHGSTGIDLNRAGTPLIEVVSAPAMHSAAEAVAYMRAVHRLVTWLGICDGNLQEGSFRCDANVSVRPRGETALGTRAEIKNVNSFRFVEKAIAYEIERQIREREAGRAIVQETRLYDETRDATRSMRSKESAHDYRYFPDPDLPPMIIDSALLDAVRASLPELPEPRRRRYLDVLGLPAVDAEALTAERASSDFFEAVLAETGPAQAKLAANWVLGEWATRMHERATAADAGDAAPVDLAASPVAARQLALLIRRVTDGTLSSTAAKAVFGGLWTGEGEVDAIIATRGLAQVNDDGALGAAIDQVLAASPTQVGQFRAGDEKVFGWLVGQVMRAMRGKANPQRLNELLREKLA